VCWGCETSLKSAILIFPLMTLRVFHMQMNNIMHNFTFTLLDELSAYVVSCWCTLCVVCMCKNDLVSLVSHTKLSSPYMLRANAICECMFHTHHSKSIPIYLEWYSCGVTRVASSCIFHVIFHLENFQVVTIGVPRSLIQPNDLSLSER
jgi:hypothetical protein